MILSVLARLAADQGVISHAQRGDERLRASDGHCRGRSRSGSRIQARLALQHGRHVFLMCSLLEHEWAPRLRRASGVTVVETADDVFAGLERLASESTDLIWA